MSGSIWRGLVLAVVLSLAVWTGLLLAVSVAIGNRDAAELLGRAIVVLGIGVAVYCGITQVAQDVLGD